jgi:hypothetical protein
MIDSMIVARALSRLGPFARAARAEGRSRREAGAVERRPESVAVREDVRPHDPWRVGAARAAFTIWAVDAAGTAATRQRRNRA